MTSYLQAFFCTEKNSGHLKPGIVSESNHPCFAYPQMYAIMKPIEVILGLSVSTVRVTSIRLFSSSFCPRSHSFSSTASMHPSKSYRGTPEEENLLFAEQRGFGVWVINGTAEDGDSPVIATAPFYLEPFSYVDGCNGGHEKGQEQVISTAKAHLMKDNTLGRVCQVKTVPHISINYYHSP